MSLSAAEIFFRSLKDDYEECPLRVTLKLGAKILVIHFSGDRIKKIMLPSIAHLLTDLVAPPDVRIYCLEQQVEFPWSLDDYGVQGLINGYNDHRFQTAYQHGSGAVMMYDHTQQEGIYSIGDAGNIPYWEISFPFRTIFHWWSRDTDYQLLHAGGIGLPNASVLLSGKSGSGKSSTTLSGLLNDELSIAGDDYILVDTLRCEMYALYNCTKVEWDNLERLEYLKPVTDSSFGHAEKAMVFLNKVQPEKLLFKSRLKYSFIPVITMKSFTSVVPGESSEALKSLAPTTLFQLPGGRIETFRKCSLLIRQLGVYKIMLGTDAAEIADSISKFLHQNHDISYHSGI